MAIAYTTESYDTQDFGPSTSTADVEITVPNGTTLLVVACAYKNNTRDDPGPSSAVWDWDDTAQSMTKQGEAEGDSTNRWCNAQIWTLENPTPGTLELQFTKDVNRSEEFSMTAFYITGEDASPIGAVVEKDVGAGGSGGSADFTDSITTTKANSLIIASLGGYLSASPVAWTESVITEDNVTTWSSPTYTANHAQGHYEASSIDTYTDLGWDADSGTPFGGLVLLEIKEATASDIPVFMHHYTKNNGN